MPKKKVSKKKVAKKVSKKVMKKATKKKIAKKAANRATRRVKPKLIRARPKLPLVPITPPEPTLVDIPVTVPATSPVTEDLDPGDAQAALDDAIEADEEFEAAEEELLDSDPGVEDDLDGDGEVEDNQ